MKKALKSIIEDHQIFLLTTHMNPDGDGIGSATAMIELLLGLKKKVRFISPSPIPKQFAFLDYHQAHEVYQTGKNYQADVLIVLDTHEKERIGPIENLLSIDGLSVVSIDHHKQKKTISHLNWIDPKACSCGALVFTLFEVCRVPFTLRAAKGIYTSILCDTGRFSYSSTDEAAHKIAETCIRAGVDPDEMYKKIFQHVTLEEMRMCARVMQKMETYFSRSVVILQIEKEDWGNADIEHMDLEYFLELHKLIENIECVILLRELPKGEVRVSMRSREIDVNEILKGLGGGGHTKAGGLSWKGKLQDVKKILLQNLENSMKLHQARGKEFKALASSNVHFI